MATEQRFASAQTQPVASGGRQPRAASSGGPGPRRLFWDGGAGRARTVWLIALPLLGVYGSLLVAAGLLAGVLPLPAEALVVNAIAAAMALVLVVASRRWLGARRSLPGYGLALDRRWVTDLLAGFGIGLVAVTVPFLVGVAGGWLEVVAVLDAGAMALWPGIALVAGANLCVGLWEELMLRGVFVRTAADGLVRWMSPRHAVAGAIAVSATVFGLAHYGQPQQARFLVTWVLAGVVFGIVYVRSGTLALPIGAHAAYNIAYQAVFVRTDIDGIEAVSAITRIAVDPTVTALGFGGALEAVAFVLVGLLAAPYLRATRRGRFPGGRPGR